MNHWNCSNRQYAEMKTLNLLLGYLEAHKGQQLHADDISAFIHQTINKQTADLDTRYPDRKES